MPLMYELLLLYYDTGFDIWIQRTRYQLATGHSTSLPRRPSDLDILLVRREGGHKDFRVRKSVVLRGLRSTTNTIHEDFHGAAIQT